MIDSGGNFPHPVIWPEMGTLFLLADDGTNGAYRVVKYEGDAESVINIYSDYHFARLPDETLVIYPTDDEELSDEPALIVPEKLLAVLERYRAWSTADTTKDEPADLRALRQRVEEEINALSSQEEQQSEE